MRAALGSAWEGTRLYRSSAVVELVQDDEGYQLSTTLWGRRASEQSWPERRLPPSSSEADLADAFRQLVTTVEEFLNAQGMRPGPLTFPRA